MPLADKMKAPRNPYKNYYDGIFNTDPEMSLANRMEIEEGIRIFHKDRPNPGFFPNKDQLQTIGRDALERNSDGYAKTIGKGLMRGTEGLMSGVGSMAEWAGDLTGSPTLAEAGRTSRKYWNEAAAKGVAAADPYTSAGTFFENPSFKRGIGIVAEAAPSMGVAMATGGAGISAGLSRGSAALLGASVLGGLEGAPQYSEAREAGKSIGEASAIGGLSMAGTMALEYLPISRMFKRTDGIISRGLKGGIEEAGQEATQTFWQNMIAKYGYDGSRNLAEGILESIIGGFGTGAPMGMVFRDSDGKDKKIVRDNGQYDPEDVEAGTADIAGQVQDFGETHGPVVKQGLVDKVNAENDLDGLIGIKAKLDNPDLSPDDPYSWYLAKNGVTHDDINKLILEKHAQQMDRAALPGPAIQPAPERPTSFIDPAYDATDGLQPGQREDIDLDVANLGSIEAVDAKYPEETTPANRHANQYARDFARQYFAGEDDADPFSDQVAGVPASPLTPAPSGPAGAAAEIQPSPEDNAMVEADIEESVPPAVAPEPVMLTQSGRPFATQAKAMKEARRKKLIGKAIQVPGGWGVAPEATPGVQEPVVEEAAPTIQPTALPPGRTGEDRRHSPRREAEEIDSLTGIPGSNAIRPQIEQAKKDQNKLVFFFDIDNFKAVNDVYGHDAGDKVLGGIGRVISETFGDVPHGRFGGEEFSVILDKTPENIERVKAFASNIATQMDYDGEPITISGGLASGTSINQKTKKEQLRADSLAYKAKGRGRNRVVVDIGDGNEYDIAGPQVKEKQYVTEHDIRSMETVTGRLLESSIADTPGLRDALERAVLAIKEASQKRATMGREAVRGGVPEETTAEVTEPETKPTEETLQPPSPDGGIAIPEEPQQEPAKEAAALPEPPETQAPAPSSFQIGDTVEWSDKKGQIFTGKIVGRKSGAGAKYAPWKVETAPGDFKFPNVSGLRKVGDKAESQKAEQEPEKPPVVDMAEQVKSMSMEELSAAYDEAQGDTAGKAQAEPEPSDFRKVVNGVQIPHFIENKNPTVKNGQKIIDSAIVHRKDKGQNVYRISVVEEADGNRYAMVEKAFDQRGTASRVDTRFEELKNDEIENDKWVNGQAAGFFKTVNARNTETKQEKKHQEKKAKRAEVQTKAGMTDDEIKKINPSFIGRNSDGQMLFKDDKGVRYRMDGRIRISEPLTVGLSREKGVSLQPDRSAHSEFQTKEETESAQPASRSVDDIIASAASHGVKGVGESFKALYDLLGGGALKSGPLAFDEDTYQKAKPHFQAAFDEFRAAGKDIKEFFKFIGDQFANGKVYVMEFLKDLRGEREAPDGKKLTGTESEPSIQSKSQGDFVEWIVEKIGRGEKFTWQELFRQADFYFGGTQAQGKYTPKDAYDMIETAVNKFIRRKAYLNDLRSPETIIKELEGILDLLPTQTKRTQEQDEFQQFSTVPPLAYVANWAANLNGDDVYLEPSAGTGGLLSFADNVKSVIANELSARRADILKNSKLADRVFTEDAEQINNILPQDVKPTVVVMNPPFSATAGRLKTNKTKFGGRHIEEALKRLEPGGRLVVITGQGMAMDAPSFMEWWKGIKGKYNVRANIGMSGEGYKKYGTTFDNQLIIIDKTGPTSNTIITGKVERYEQLLPLLEGVRNDRPKTTESNQKIESSAGKQEGAAVPGRNEGNPERPDGSQPSIADAADRTGKSEPDQGRGRSDTGIVERQPDGTGETSQPETGGGIGQPGETGNEPAGKPGQEPDRSPELKSEIEVVTADQKRGDELTDSLYDQYKPKVSTKGAKPHPTPLVQSTAMADTELPDSTYAPNLPKEIITSGKISAAQLEAVVYAGRAHNMTMRDKKTRRGFFIGDGTGVGKGREISAILMDNWRNGRKKAVWVSETSKLVEDAKRDLNGIGWADGAGQVFTMAGAKPGSEIGRKQGILFTTYSTLSSRFTKIREDMPETFEDMTVRVNQIVKWLGKDFDGVIAFDESHNMANAVATKGDRGNKDASQRARAGLLLQSMLPNARVVYVSATGATEVSNLIYAQRLGLWGEGTPFSSAQKFVDEVSAGGLAAMELISRDLKSMGLYLARSLSYDGVSYTRLEHELTPPQRDIYDNLAEAWQIVLQNINAALEETGGNRDKNTRARAMSQFWGSHQRFFNTVITSMQMPSVIAAVKKDIADGHAVIMQLVSTGEAQAQRSIANLEEGQDIDDLDMTPREALMHYVEKSFPTQQYEEYTDDNGDIKVRPVYDSAGNPVQNAEAVAMKEKLLDKLGSIKVPSSALEIIMDALGTERVAEVTGRTQRVVFDAEQGKKVIERWSDAKSSADADAFQDDKKQVLVFSEKGGTGRSYHADKSAKNQRKRKHYLVQPGWRADKAVQGLGRSHRSNQKQTPEFILVTTDLKGQKRFLSSIARRLDQLGALTKGQRQTGSQGIFQAKDNLESQYAVFASQRFFEFLNRGVYSDIGLNVEEFERQTGLSIRDEDGRLRDTLPNIRQFLNRMLSMNIDMQNKVFDAFDAQLESVVSAHAANGTLDVGIETIRGQSVRKAQEVVVNEDAELGKTQYVRIEVDRPSRRIKWDDASKSPSFYQNVKSGRIYAASEPRNTTDFETGEVTASRTLRAANFSSQSKPVSDLEGEKWREVPKKEAKTLWTDEYNKINPITTDTHHIIAGTLLPIWDRLKGSSTIYRMQTDDGERILGRVIPEKHLDQVLQNLNVEGGAASVSMNGRELADAVLDGATVRLDNKWTIKKSMVSGDERIEITGPEYEDMDLLQKQGVFTERIQWKTRFFVPTGDQAGEIIDRVMSGKKIAKVDSPASDVLFSARDADDLDQGDREYLDAVERGDMDAAQRMVNEAAEKAGAVIRPRLERAVVHTTREYIEREHREDFIKAKAGDVEAAARVIEKTIKPERVKELARKYPDAIVCAVHAEEASGKNKLPIAYADAMEAIGGFENDKDIVQSTSVQHTGKGAAYRLANRPEFDGDVQPGRKYILVDDHITAGGTLMALRRHIEKGGGVVVATSSLTASNNGTILELQPETAKAITGKFGYEKLNHFVREFGIGESIYDISENEARWLLKNRSIESAGNRLAQERQTAGGRGAQGPVRSSSITPKTPIVKTLDPVTYDDNGKPIPLSQRFNPESDDIRFSQKPQQPRLRMSKKSDVEDAIAGIMRRWENIPATVVVQTVQELPEDDNIRSSAEYASRRGKIVEGVFNKRDRTIYLVADNLRPDRIARVLVHESIGHFGLRQTMGKRLDKFLDKLAFAKRSELKSENPNLNLMDKDKTRIAAEEWLARKIEQGNVPAGWWKRLVAEVRAFIRDLGVDLKLTDADIEAVIRRAYAAVEQGKGRGPGLDADGRIRPRGRGRRNFRFAAAFHGTPHVWPPEKGFPHGRPRLDKIGTGEGAAAYGWGFYLSSVLDVAEAYRKNLSDSRSGRLGSIGNVPATPYERLSNSMAVDAKNLSELLVSDPFVKEGFGGLNIPSRRMVMNHVLSLLKDGQVLKSVVGDIPIDVMNVLVGSKRPADAFLNDNTMFITALSSNTDQLVSSGSPAATVLSLITARDTAIGLGGFDVSGIAQKLLPTKITSKINFHVSSIPQPYNSVNGSLYNLDIPDDVLPKLLDWDKPLSEQSDYIKNRLRMVNKDYPHSNPNVGSKEITGEVFYKELSFAVGRSNKAASEYLASIGIPGNKYLDQGSRGTGDIWAYGPSKERIEEIAKDWADDGVKDIKISKDGDEWSVRGNNKTLNFVLWDQKVLDRVALLERNGEKLDAIREAEAEILLSSRDRDTQDGMASKPGKGDITTGKNPNEVTPEGGNPFKDSVVQESVYRGSDYAADDFDGHIYYFSKNKKYASNYGPISSSYINLEKPFVFDFDIDSYPGTYITFDQFQKEIAEIDPSVSEIIESHRAEHEEEIDLYGVNEESEPWSYINTAWFKSALEKRGYDGIQAIEKGYQIFGVLNRAQIKQIPDSSRPPAEGGQTPLFSSRDATPDIESLLLDFNDNAKPGESTVDFLMDKHGMTKAEAEEAADQFDGARLSINAELGDLFDGVDEDSDLRFSMRDADDLDGVEATDESVAPNSQEPKTPDQAIKSYPNLDKKKVEAEKKRFDSEFPERLKDAWEILTKKPYREKEDTSVAMRIVRTPEFWKIPTLKRLFKATLDRPDNYYKSFNAMIEQQGKGVSHIETLKKLKAESPEEYKKVADYLIKADRNQIGINYTIEEETDSEGKNPVYKVYHVNDVDTDGTGERSPLAEFKNEADAYRHAYKLTADEFVKDGKFTRIGADAWMGYRIVMDNGFENLALDIRELMRKYEDAGKPPPTIAVRTEDGNVEIDMRTALAILGDRRGYYAPRQRTPGKWRMTAKKAGTNPIMEFFDTKTMMNLRMSKLAKQGYNVETSFHEQMPEDVFEIAGKTMGTQALINQALGKVKMGMYNSLEDIGIKTKWDDLGDGKKRMTLISRIPRADHIPVFESLGGKYRWKERAGKSGKFAQGEWVFDDAATDIEEKIKDRIFDVEGITPDVDLMLATSLAQQIADTFKGRGFRSSMIGRSDAKGKDVFVGYEEDPLVNAAQYARGIAAGMAKKQMAVDMTRVITGTDIGWDNFKETPEGRTYMDRIEELQGKKDGGEEKLTESEWEELKGLRQSLYEAYKADIKDRRLDPEKQPNAFKEARVFTEDMLRNDEWLDRVAGTIKGVAVLKYLGGRIAAPLVNLTALATSVPASMQGYAGISIPRAFKAIVRGGEAFRKYRFGGEGELSPELRAMFEQIEDRGWNTAQYNKEALSVLQSKGGRIWTGLVEKSMWLFGVTEQINRVSTIAGTYMEIMDRNKIGENGVDDDALEKAKEVSDRAHGIYGKSTLPHWARGGDLGAQAARAMYVFKKFSHNYMMTMIDLGVNQKDIKSAAYMAIAPAVLGGAGASVITPIVSAILKAFGYDDDPEEDFYNWLRGLFGETGENAARFGIPGMFGHGISLKGSLNVGVGDLPTSIADLFGAPGSVITDIYEGGASLVRGDISKGIEKIVPNAIGAPIRAYREYDEGVTTRTNAPVFYGKDPLKLDFIDAAIRAASFNPSRVAKIREKQWKEREVEMRMTEERADIYARFRKYFMDRDRDPAKYIDLLNEVRIYNERIQRKGAGGIPMMTNKSIKQNLRKSFRPNKKERMRIE